MIFVCQERNYIHPWSFTFILSYFWILSQVNEIFFFLFTFCVILHASLKNVVLRKRASYNKPSASSKNSFCCCHFINKKKKKKKMRFYSGFHKATRLINITDEGSDLSRNVWLNRVNNFWTLKPIFFNVPFYFI